MNEALPLLCKLSLANGAIRSRGNILRNQDCHQRDRKRPSKSRDWSCSKASKN